MPTPCCNALLKVYVRAQDSARCMRVLQDMQERTDEGEEDAAPDATTYTLVLRTLQDKGDFRAAQQVFDTMQSGGTKVDAMAISAMLQILRTASEQLAVVCPKRNTTALGSDDLSHIRAQVAATLSLQRASSIKPSIQLFDSLVGLEERERHWEEWSVGQEGGRGRERDGQRDRQTERGR